MPTSSLQRVYLMFSSGSFIMLDFTFRFIIHFINFSYSEKYGSVHYFQEYVWLFSTIYWRDYPLPTEMSWDPC